MCERSVKVSRLETLVVRNSGNRFFRFSGVVVVARSCSWIVVAVDVTVVAVAAVAVAAVAVILIVVTIVVVVVNRLALSMLLMIFLFILAQLESNICKHVCDRSTPPSLYWP